MKRGPSGHFPRSIWTSMKNAFVTFIKLEQANSQKQSSLTTLAKRVNVMANAAGFWKTGNDLARKLKSETAHLFEIDTMNLQEARRLQWTTYGNLNVWYETFKQTLIDLGFARETMQDGTEDHLPGELCFFEGQTRRIINVDETDGTLDNTNGKRGGRKPMVFYAPDVGGGGSSASKSSYSPTIICGSNAAGEALPPHFQLKSMAQTEDRERFNLEFLEHIKDLHGVFGHGKKTVIGCTFGMNERAGMNAEELNKYFHTNILPLYPDIDDKPLKRVIAKVDKGPGRMDVGMLAALKLKGLHLTPGVPNTTSVTQETDQNYGPFKTHYRYNLSTLAEARFAMKLQLSINDLGLLVFGGIDPVTKVELRASFDMAFSPRICLSSWKKCGAVPLTREALHSDKVRHETIVNRDGSTNTDIDPMSAALVQMEMSNHMSCDFLSTMGYDGSQLRIDAPKQSAKKFEITVPNSKERVEAIQRAKTAGQLFHATHGHHLNSDDFFRARAKTDRETEKKTLLAQKKVLLRNKQRKLKAMAVRAKKGDPIEGNKEHNDKFLAPELLALATWKLGKEPKDKKIASLMPLCTNTPDPIDRPEWSTQQEARLQELENTDIQFEDTALHVALKQNAKSIKNNIDNLDADAAADLLQALQQKVQATSTITTDALGNEHSII